MARRSNPAKAVQVLDAMLEFFDGGRRWTRGALFDSGNTKACLVGATVLCATKPREEYQIILGEPDRDAYHYLFIAFTKTSAFMRYLHPDRRLSLESYNDTSRSFARIGKLIRAARAIAQGELENVHERPRRSRPVRQPRAEGGVSGDPRHPMHDAPRASAGERSYQGDPVHAA
jgi:hypothetical protein